MEKLTIEEYKAMGDAIKQANKNLKFIQKYVIQKDITFTKTCHGDFIDNLSTVMCELCNLSEKLEDQMDEEHPSELIETIGYFN